MRGSPRDSCTIHCPEAFSENTNTALDLRETFSFLTVQFIVSSIAFRCAREFTRQASKLFTSQQALEPTERQKRESRNVSTESHLSSGLLHTSTRHVPPWVSWAHTKLSYSNQALFHAQNVSCLVSLIKLPFFSPRAGKKKVFVFNKPKL